MMQLPAMNILRLLAALAVAALAAGCATTPSAPTGTVIHAPSATAPATPPAPPPSPLESEVRWMRQLFNGTPVAIDTERDGAMRVEVPMQFAFDGDGAVVKPPLAAVLDRVAISMKRHPTSRVHVAAPGKSAAARSAAMQAHLKSRGVAPARIAMTAAKREEVVALKLVPGQTPIDRLDDSKLPPPPAPPAH
jgi:hypothetical protein